MIPPCRLCNGEGCVQDSTNGPWSGCPRCLGSTLDQAWHITATPAEQDGYTTLRIAYGAHGSAEPVALKNLPTGVVDLLLDALSPHVRRGVIVRDRRPNAREVALVVRGHPAGGYCLAEADRAHETFQCFEPTGHHGPHLAGPYRAPCPTCDGLAHHADTCPTPDWTEDPTTQLREVAWDNDGPVRVR